MFIRRHMPAVRAGHSAMFSRVLLRFLINRKIRLLFGLSCNIGQQVLVPASIDISFDDIHRAFNSCTAGIDQQIIYITSAPLVVSIELIVFTALLVYLLDFSLHAVFIEILIRELRLGNRKISLYPLFYRSEYENTYMPLIAQYVICCTTDDYTALFSSDLSDDPEFFFLDP